MGISLRHGPHQVAQKLSMTGVPRRSKMLSLVSDIVVASKKGASAPISGAMGWLLGPDTAIAFTVARSGNPAVQIMIAANMVQAADTVSLNGRERMKLRA